MRIIRLSFAMLFIGACSTELTEQGARVRPISQEAAQSCAFLGTVSGTEALGMSIAGDVQSASNQLRNQVAAVGGNGYVMNQTSSTMDATVMVADAYSC